MTWYSNASADDYAAWRREAVEEAIALIEQITDELHGARRVALNLRASVERLTTAFQNLTQYLLHRHHRRTVC
jgi:methylthioribose-1-phosphate isomerase